MARFNEIQVGRFNRLMQKLFSMKGSPPAPQLASELQMVHPVFHGAENRYLESWNRFSLSFGAAAVAAVVIAMRLRNPSGSNVIAVLEKITIVGDTTAANEYDLFGGTTSSDLANSLGGSRMDARSSFPINVGGSLIASFENNLASRPPMTTEATRWFGTVPANDLRDVILTDDQEWTLLPGDAFQINSASVNVGVRTSLLWRERFLEDSERA